MVHDRKQVFENHTNHGMDSSFYVNNCRTSRISRTLDELSVKEFIAAELVVLNLSQHESFNGVNEPKLNTLNVYEDENGILRLKSPVIN